MKERVQIFTDAATICVYDPERLKHRVDDDPDWWTYPPSEVIGELNRGNLMAVDIGSDGVYDLRIHDGPVKHPDWSVSAKLACSSGKLFAGKGEAIPSGGFGPDEQYDGVFVSVPPGTYNVTIAPASAFFNEFEISMQKVDGPAENSFDDELRLLSETWEVGPDDVEELIGIVKSKAEEASHQPDADPLVSWALDKLQELEEEFKVEPSKERLAEQSKDIHANMKKSYAFGKTELGEMMLLISSQLEDLSKG